MSSSARGGPLLEVRDLVRTFGGVRAVDGVSFRVEAGETIGLIGPNGSGKTTVFNLVSGLLWPQAGEVVFAGEAVTGRRPEEIAERGIGRTFQNGRVFGNMSVEENLLVGAHGRLAAARPAARWRHGPVVRWVPLLLETLVALGRPRAARREADRVRREATAELGRFGDRLVPRRDHPAYSLSYANRRRTELARALAMQPRLLLLDEPTAGMNPTETAELLDQLTAIRRAGLTMLLIEHKLDLVMALCDRVLVLDYGKLIAEGTAAAVQADERVIEAYLGRRRGGGVAARTPDAAP